MLLCRHNASLNISTFTQTDCNLRREWREKAIAVRGDKVVEEVGEQEIRWRAAEQAEKWLVKLRGELEEKKTGRRGEDKREGGVENVEGLEGVTGIDFKGEDRVNAGRMKQMNVEQEQGG